MKKYMAVAGVDIPLPKNDFEFTLLAPDKLIAKQVQHHADMILAIFDNKIFCHKSYFEDNKEIIKNIADFGKLEIVLSDCKRNDIYPFDIAFNALTIGDRLICKKDYICPELEQYDIINTKQGYAGCTALYAADTVITADEATIKACRENNIPYFEISGEDILLHGYDTGFIGGACGVCGDTIYIYGDPSTSQSGRELAEFCKDKGLNLSSVYDGPVTDIGGIKFIEKI